MHEHEHDHGHNDPLQQIIGMVDLPDLESGSIDYDDDLVDAVRQYEHEGDFPR